MKTIELMIHSLLLLTVVLMSQASMVQAPPNTRQLLNADTREYDDENFDESSGDGPTDESDMDEDEYIDESGDANPTSLCQRQELEASARNQSPDNMYIPQCTPAGGFEPKQCSTMKKERKKIVQCWCVNENGHELSGTRNSAAHAPNCSPVPVDISGKSVHSTTSRNNFSGVAAGKGGGDGSSRGGPKKDSNKGTTKFSISPVSNDQTEEELNYEQRAGSSNNEGGGKAVAVTSIRQIGVLAGVIGGAFLVLVLAVLLVLFVVYRMRKKDEGSYALEEPKGSPSIGYTKTNDREFFA